MADKSNWPTESGVYLGKSSSGYTWWNLIVFVSGESPYLEVATFNRQSHEYEEDVPPYDIYEFGDRICE